MISIREVLVSLVPQADFVIRGDEVEWRDATIPRPSDEQIAAEAARLEALRYKRQRAAEYPPITDYIDGVVKGDQAQIDAYIQACLAVKAKYPKPSA